MGRSSSSTPVPWVPVPSTRVFRDKNKGTAPTWIKWSIMEFQISSGRSAGRELEGAARPPEAGRSASATALRQLGARAYARPAPSARSDIRVRRRGRRARRGTCRGGRGDRRGRDRACRRARPARSIRDGTARRSAAPMPFTSAVPTPPPARSPALRSACAPKRISTGVERFASSESIAEATVSRVPPSTPGRPTLRPRSPIRPDARAAEVRVGTIHVTSRRSGEAAIRPRQRADRCKPKRVKSSPA